MHVPSTINQNMVANGNALFFAAVPGTYIVTGTPLTNDTFEDADRAQRVPLGCEIPSIIYDISIRDATDSSSVEYCLFKVERAHEVPTTNDGLLPSSNSILTEGLQAAMRKYQPGRVIKFGVISVAAEQPLHRSIKGNYGKFKMAKVRTGDYYGIILFNRTGGTGTLSVDVQMRYNALV